MRRKGLVSLLAVALLFVGTQSVSAQNLFASGGADQSFARSSVDVDTRFGAPVGGGFKFGPRAAFGTDYDFAIGGMATLGFNTVLFEGTGPLTGSLAFDYFIDCPFDNNLFGNDDFSCSFFEIAPTAFVPISGGFYAGAGLNYARYSASYDGPSIPGVDTDLSSSDIGLALQGGYMFPLGGMSGMADARFALGGSEQLVLAFALMFGGSN
jgi:hypothetical protein